MTAIEFEHVSKQYRLGLVSTKTLSHDIRRFWITNVLGKEDPYLKIGETNDRASKGNSEYVWALRDIDFKVEQGDVVGIIGKNGAGKSTLLKLLSRVTGPTTGTIRAHGRIGSLLEVGTGFHGEMTGRENIFMNGAILGMSRNEIQAKLDEIIDFSGCERYIDTPVKRYSSGMTVRLGFAVAAFLEPEILVVDEVLAVGDAEFQKKAIGKMKDVSQGQGRTVLFVSHNMGSVRALCNHGVLLKNGMVDYIGDIDPCVDKYLAMNQIEERLSWEPNVDPTVRVETRRDDVEFKYIGFKDNNNNFNTIDDIVYEFEIHANKDVPNCRINLTINTMMDVPVGTVICGDTFSIKKGETKRVRMYISNHNMVIGMYKTSFAIGYGAINEALQDFQIVFDAVCLNINRYSESKDYYNWGGYRGPIYFPHKLEVVQ